MSNYNRKCQIAQIPKIINYQFKLYLELKVRFKINNNNIYNFNKKRVIIGVIEKVYILVNKVKKNLYTI